MRPIFFYKSSLKLRLTLAVILELVIIIIDSYSNIFSMVRMYMNTTISPFYFISNVPQNILDFISQNLSSRNQLELENKNLRREVLLKNSELLMLMHYKQENERLRELLGSPLLNNEHKMIAQVIYNIDNPYCNQLVIDKGRVDGVYEGQPVINDKGIVGQVVSVAKLTSRVLLICDTSHALPIQVLRNNVRLIAEGNGCTNDLKLVHTPDNTDIRVGDVLVTSGLGGRFPEGYPVAIVSSVQLDKQYNYIVIYARPTACLQRLKYLLLWDSNHNNNIMTPEEVHHISNKRLIRMVKIFSDLPTYKNIEEIIVNYIGRACYSKSTVQKIP